MISSRLFSALLFSVALCFLSLSCRKEDSLLLKITPEELEIPVEAGDDVHFRISVSSPSPVSRLIIESIGNGMDSVLLDTVPMTKSFFMNWSYQTPINSLKNVQLLFRAINDAGDEFTAQRLLVVQMDDALSLIYDNLMYSVKNGSFNSFDFFSMSSVTYDSSLFDSLQGLLPDVREFNNNPNATPNEISGFWYSPSGGKFVKTTSVNFSNIKKEELLGFFNGSYNPLNYTDSLQVGDIYAYKSAANDTTPVVCLFRIDEMIFGPNTQARYKFSVKK